MAYCSHCGKLAEGGRFCAACGAPVAPDVVAAVTADMRRRSREMRLIAAALGLLLVVTAGLVIGTSRRAGPAGATSVVPGQSPSTPATEARNPPAQALADASPNPASQPQHGPQQQLPLQPQDQHRQLPELQESQPQRRPPVQADVSSDSDRYPGSVPIQVDNANLPDIGVPVATEVYTTSDSVSAVVGYYQQRYPGVAVTEVNGQKVIAIDRPGMTKVIAVGTTGSETRIAMVQPK
jgi:hypothetical protein